MPWETTPYRPPIPNPKGRLPRNPSVAAGRICGCLGFFLSGYLCDKAAERILGLPHGWVEGKWTPAETVAVGAILLLSMVGGLIGFGAGLHVAADNRELTRLSLILWHFLADGQIVCFFSIGLVWRREHHPLTTQEALPIFGWFAAAALLSGLVLFALGQFRENAEPRPLLWIVVGVPPILWVAYHIRDTIHLDERGAILFGLIAGLAIVFLSARMIQRDYRQMREVKQ
jgi:hypothetical protein